MINLTPAAGRGFFMKEFKIGDRVKFKDAVGEGLVVKTVGSKIWVQDGFGFDRVYEAIDLLPIAEEIDIGHLTVKDKPFAKSRPASQQVDRLIIDLHSHELLDTTHGMKPYDILNYQIQCAVDTIDEARRRNISKVLIIHGKGKGRLQEEVHDMLRRMGGNEFYFADYKEGGYGATEVRLMGRA